MIPSAMLNSLSRLFQGQDRRMVRIAEEQAALSAQNRALAGQLRELEQTNRALAATVDRLAGSVERMAEQLDRTPERRPPHSPVRPTRLRPVRPLN